MNRKPRYVPFQAIYFMALVFLLLATNRWMDWDSGISHLFLSDVRDGYQPIAEAAPSFPDNRIPAHIAQRFFLPFVLGALAKAFGLSVSILFIWAEAVFHLLILGGAWWVLGAVSVPPNRKLVAIALFALQPYSLRYYWIGPGMAGDSLFVLASLLVMVGLFQRKIHLFFLAVLLAALARQTAVMLIPGIFFFLLWGGPWRGDSKGRKVAYAGLACFMVLFIYSTTLRVVERFSLPSPGSSLMYGIFSWLASENFNLTILGEHLLRCLLPLAPAFFLLAASVRLRLRSWNPASLSAFLMSSAIAAQPFLAGPAYTGKNAARLVTLGLLPLVFSWALAETRELSSRFTALIVCALVLGSFHHSYTYWGPANPAQTAALQLVVSFSVLAFALMERIRPQAQGLNSSSTT
jgi:hypothetical protein